MQRGRAYSRGTNPWKITPSPLKAIERWVESLPVALKNPVGEPYSGTDPKRLWLLRSRPDQVHRRTMRRGPPTGILAELRFACLQPSGWRAPGGRYVAPSPALPPRGREGWLCFACHFWLASLCLFACFALPFLLASLASLLPSFDFLWSDPSLCFPERSSDGVGWVEREMSAARSPTSSARNLSDNRECLAAPGMTPSLLAGLRAY